MFDSYSIRVDMKATGRKIKELRIQKELKVEEFAEIMHSSQNTIFKWQRGECLPTIDNLLILSRLFGIPMDEIIQCEEGPDEGLLPINGIFTGPGTKWCRQGAFSYKTLISTILWNVLY
jgi:transcriptional regulator with XRE-family HTH domain